MIHDVGGEFGGRALQNALDARNDSLNRIMQSRRNFVGFDVDIFRQARQYVAPANADSAPACAGISRADFDLDIFGGAFANHEVVFLLDVKLDVAVEFVARHAEAFAYDDTAQRYNSNVAGTAAYVDDHGTHRLGNIYARAQCRRYWFFD